MGDNGNQWTQGVKKMREWGITKYLIHDRANFGNLIQHFKGLLEKENETIYTGLWTEERRRQQSELMNTYGKASKSECAGYFTWSIDCQNRQKKLTSQSYLVFT